MLVDGGRDSFFAHRSPLSAHFLLFLACPETHEARAISTLDVRAGCVCNGGVCATDLFSLVQVRVALAFSYRFVDETIVLVEMSETWSYRYPWYK